MPLIIFPDRALGPFLCNYFSLIPQQTGYLKKLRATIMLKKTALHNEGNQAEMPACLSTDLVGVSFAVPGQ